MKILKSWFAGAVTLVWDSGNLSLNFDESLGGGAAKGILKGQGSLCLGAMTAIDLAEEDVNKLIPASFLPLVQAIEAVANPAIEAAL